MSCVASRDSKALESLYERYHQMVYGIGLRLLGNRASAEDLTQTVFCKIWANPSAFRGQRGSFNAWISTVSRNAGLDLLRRQSTYANGFAADRPLDHTVERVVFADLDARQVRSALARLPAKERSLIELGYFSGFTHRRLAMETGLPLGTVKTRIRAGLRRLREILEAGTDRLR